MQEQRMVAGAKGRRSVIDAQGRRTVADAKGRQSVVGAKEGEELSVRRKAKRRQRKAKCHRCKGRRSIAGDLETYIGVRESGYQCEGESGYCRMNKGKKRAE